MLELAIDYCAHVTTRVTTDYKAELNAIPEVDPFLTLDKIKGMLLDDVVVHEPYCGQIKGCVLTNFKETGTDGTAAPGGGGIGTAAIVVLSKGARLRTRWRACTSSAASTRTCRTNTALPWV